MTPVIQKPNCENCPYFPDDDMRCPIEYSTDQNYAERTTTMTGCLYHPGAREYLMAPVIAELERLSKQNVGTQYRHALEEAIALLKGGKV